MTELTPIDWAKRPIQKYAEFSGRASRAEYWWYTLAVIIAYIAVSIVESIIGMDKTVGPYGYLSVLLMLGTLVPSIAVGVRRLHDTNRSGWWVLLPIIPYGIGIALAGPAIMSGSMAGLGVAGIFFVIGLVCAIALIVFMVLAGTKGDNSYGADPYEGSSMASAA